MIRTPEIALDVVGSIERRIQSRTHGRVKGLRVEVADQAVVLHGRAPTYYTKQLALDGALDAIRDAAIINEIVVG